MNDLINLIYVLEHNLHFNANNWDYIKESLSIPQKELLQQALKNRELTDMMAANLYNRSSPQSTSYRHNKRKVKEALIRSISGYKTSNHNHNNFQRAYYDNHRLLSVINILRGLEYTRLAFTLADQVYITSRKYHLTDINIELAQFLSRYFYVITPNLKKAKAFAKQAIKANSIRKVELEIEQLYSEYISYFVKTKSSNRGIIKDYESQLIKFAKYSTKKLESYRFYIYYYLLHIQLSKAKGNFDLYLKYSLLGYDHFCGQKYDHNTAKSLFIIHTSSAYLQLNLIPEARESIQEAIVYLDKGRRNWFNMMYYLIQIEIVEKNYQEAYDYYQEMIRNKYFEEQPTERREVFRLYGIYLDFLNLINVVQAKNKPTKYEIKKITRHVPTFARDHKGMKIPIIIGQLLFLIHDKEYDEIINKLDVLKDYCSRHLVRKSPYYRSHCFIKMLLLIPVNLFNPVAVKRKGDKFLKRLSLVPHTIAEKQSNEIEIIPYEDLWDIILSYLEKPKRISERLKAYRYG